jgi:transcriptional regulator of arginine metabolism
MKRNIRHDAIKSIIDQNEVSTQEELTEFLKEKGFDTTQATVSRDINQLGLVKIAGKTKKFKYALKPSDDVNGKIANIFKESVVSIESSLNLIVIKTYEGSANGAAAFLDKLKLQDILGTVSGDDTILVVAKSAEAVPLICKILKEYL